MAAGPQCAGDAYHRVIGDGPDENAHFHVIAAHDLANHPEAAEEDAPAALHHARLLRLYEPLPERRVDLGLVFARWVRPAPLGARVVEKRQVHVVEAHLATFLARKNTPGFGLAACTEQAFESCHHDFKVEWEKFSVSPDHPEYEQRLLEAVIR